jgi:hypothetical protein
VQPFTDELAYDDGSAERAYGIDGLGLKKFAYQFHLNKADTLSAIRVMFSNIDVDVSNLVFSMYVWDTLGIGGGFGAPEHVVKEISSVKPHYVDTINGWTTYVLDTPIILNHEFFIGWSQSDVRNLQIGYDLNSSKGRSHMFVNFGLGWDSSYIATVGSPMIRAVLNGHYSGFSTAVNSVSENSKLSLYPNPCQDKCYVKGEFTAGIAYTVTDIMGNVILNDHLWSNEIDLHQLSAGMYFINIGSASQQHSLRVTKY